jgi:hypothetical protein
MKDSWNEWLNAGVGCMLGAMAAQPKVRKVAQRQQKTKLGVLEKPKEIQNVRTEDKQVRNRFPTGLVHARRTAPCVGSQTTVHLELLMRAADALTPLHISLDHLNPGRSQSLVLVNGNYIQLA